jgi:hypothetical protein
MTVYFQTKIQDRRALLRHAAELAPADYELRVEGTPRDAIPSYICVPRICGEALEVDRRGEPDSCIVQAPLAGARQAPRHSIHNGGGAWSALSVPTPQLEGRRNNRSRELRKARHEWSAGRRDRAVRSLATPRQGTAVGHLCETSVPQRSPHLSLRDRLLPKNTFEEPLQGFRCGGQLLHLRGEGWPTYFRARARMLILLQSLKRPR